MRSSLSFVALLAILSCWTVASAYFVVQPSKHGRTVRHSSPRLSPLGFSPETTTRLSLQSNDPDDPCEGTRHVVVPEHVRVSTTFPRRRRQMLLEGLVAAGGGMMTSWWGLLLSSSAASAAAEEMSATDDFAAIAARASQISKRLDVDATVTATQRSSSDQRTAYDFALPMEGEPVPFADLVHQEFSPDKGATIKAIVVVNIKQDDPVARKTIPELMSLATKYGRGSNGALAVVACPSDQGYYEPDTSTLIRLKLASEYGYGINPSTIITDKVILLGTGSHPFWRWLQGTCRAPSGLGRIEGNFEKFLIDGRTGQPVRRYPRKYQPLNMADDIEALIAGRPLPPARANWQEEWRQAAVDAEHDTYRFEKGLNYFDQ